MTQIGFRPPLYLFPNARPQKNDIEKPPVGPEIDPQPRQRFHVSGAERKRMVWASWKDKISKLQVWQMRRVLAVYPVTGEKVPVWFWRNDYNSRQIVALNHPNLEVYKILLTPSIATAVYDRRRGLPLKLIRSQNGLITLVLSH